MDTYLYISAYVPLTNR